MTRPRRITLDDLRRLGACYEARRWFSENYPGGLTLPEEWTLQHQLYVLGHPVLRKWWAWCVENGIVPARSMCREDLRGADMRGADLGRADLRWVDLSGADLRMTDLRRASLVGADLRGADLRWADLRWVNLRWADLRGADLRWAYMSEADLRVADLSGAQRLPTDTPIPGWDASTGLLVKEKATP